MAGSGDMTDMLPWIGFAFHHTVTRRFIIGLYCDVIEQRPGRLSGAPVLNNLDLSPEEIAASLNLRREDVQAILDFFNRHEAGLTP